MIRMSSRVVDRYLAAATEDMIKNEETEIKCPCRECKQKYLLNPFNGILKGHLLANGFMYGYTRWVFPDDEEVEEVHEQVNNNDDDEEAPEVVNDEEEAPKHVEDSTSESGEEAADTKSHSSTLCSAVRDPHLQEVITKDSTTTRGAAREKLKLKQLEKDLDTPVYEGFGSTPSRLKVTLDILKQKSKFGWSYISVNKYLKYLHEELLPKGNTIPANLEEAKKSRVLLIYPMLNTTPASMITSFIETSTQTTQFVQCARPTDTRKVRKLLDKWCGTFRSFTV